MSYKENFKESDYPIRDSLEVKTDLNQVFKISDNVYKKVGENEYEIDNTKKVIHVNKVCGIVTDDCTVNKETSNCKSICVYRSHADMKWYPTNIIWNGIWEKENEKLETFSNRKWNLPDNCVAVGNEAFCLNNNKLSDKFQLSYYGYDMWYPTNLNENDNKYVYENCVITTPDICDNKNLKEGCLARCINNVNGHIVQEIKSWDGNKFNNNNLIPNSE